MLALALWNSGPDLELLDAAERGDLDTSDGIRLQVDRMLADPEKGPRFIDGWASTYLFLSKLDDVGAEVPEGGEFTPEEWSRRSGSAASPRCLGGSKQG